MQERQGVAEDHNRVSSLLADGREGTLGLASLSYLVRLKRHTELPSSVFRRLQVHPQTDDR
jgi:hypothetical protein